MELGIKRADGEVCDCGCGTKADYVLQIGKHSMTLSLACMNDLSMQILGVGTIVNVNAVQLVCGTLTDHNTGHTIDYGLNKSDENSPILFNKNTRKGVQFSWENLYLLSSIKGMNT